VPQNPDWFYLSGAPAHLGSPGKGPLNGCVCVRVYVCVFVFWSFQRPAPPSPARVSASEVSFISTEELLESRFPALTVSHFYSASGGVR